MVGQAVVGHVTDGGQLIGSIASPDVYSQTAIGGLEVESHSYRSYLLSDQGPIALRVA